VEDCVELANKLSFEWRVWHPTNSVIVVWLLASMSPSVSKMIEAMRSVAQIWNTLSNMYSMLRECDGNDENLEQGRCRVLVGRVGPIYSTSYARSIGCSRGREVG
jgi:hypothetical protein